MKELKLCYGFCCILVFLFFLLSCGKDHEDENPIDIENMVPNQFSLISPVNMSKDHDLNPTFIWEPSTDPEGSTVSYSLFLSEGFKADDLIVDNLDATQYTLNDTLKWKTQYAWKIIATDSHGNSTSSITYRFESRSISFNDPNSRVTENAEFSGRITPGVVVFENKFWVIGGGVNNELRNDVWSSTNGKDWLRRTEFAPFPPRYFHSTVVFENKLWVIGGFEEAGKYFNDIWHSTDGVNWTEVELSDRFSPRYSHTAAVFDDKLWVIAGLSTNLKLNDVWCSSNGKDWIEKTSEAEFSRRYGHTSVIFDNKLWVIGGFDGSMKNDVWSSLDGEHWIQQIGMAPFESRMNHESVVYDNNIWIMGGQTLNANKISDAWSSTNGKTWVLHSDMTASGKRSSFAMANYDNKIWVFCGASDNSIGLNDIWAFD